MESVVQTDRTRCWMHAQEKWDKGGRSPRHDMNEVWQGRIEQVGRSASIWYTDAYLCATPHNLRTSLSLLHKAEVLIRTLTLNSTYTDRNDTQDEKEKSSWQRSLHWLPTHWTAGVSLLVPHC